MHFAFLARSKAIDSLRSWAYRLISKDAPSLSADTPYRDFQPESMSALKPLRLVTKPSTRLQRPLRVLHVLECGVPRARVGRMVISGRMADVCAELDRLAALEAMENYGPV